MCNGPLVSVITPSLDQGQFLEHTIISVRSQNYQPIEHVVVDGGSRDGTLDILRHYNRSGFSYVSEPDGGQSNAVNKGLRMTSGSLVGWLNSDDCYLPGAVQAAVDAFTLHPEAVVVYGDFVNMDASSAVISLRRRPRFDVNVCTFAHITIPQPAAFIRRKALEEVGGLPEHLHYAMDFALWLALAECGEFVHIRRYLAAYRLHRAAKSVASRAAQINEVTRIRAEHCSQLGPLGICLRQCYYWTKAAYLLAAERCFLSWVGFETEEPVYAHLLRRHGNVTGLWA